MSSKNALSGSSTTGPKASIFAAKSGFVIPKNKLSGSLVPIFRGKKPGGNDAATDESTNQVLRKSKWGPDPTQDAVVRKGRALAYQTRVDQIMQQLQSGTLEPWETQDSELADPNSSAPQIDFKDSELLKLERREIIGQILKLNPTFKAPPDYEPLLKEATVPIPVKDYPGFNFGDLIFGPGGETQKRLEKETKAKIQVFGTKANQKVEISASDGGETQVAYEELNVHISADTFEKVDGAVALIELLVTSVTGNLVSGNNKNAIDQNQDTSIPAVPFGEQGTEQSMVGPAQTPLQGQFQYQGPGFRDVSAQTPGHLSHGFNPIQNFSAYNPPPVHSASLNPIDMPSPFGSQPIPASGFSSILSRPQMPMQVPLHPYPPRYFPPQPSSNASASLPFPANQTLPPPIVARPLYSSLPPPVSGAPPGPQSDRLLTPVGSSSGWSAGSAGTLGPGNILGQIAPPVTSLQGPHPVIQRPSYNMPTANAVSSISFSPGPSNVPTNHLVGPTSALQPIKSPPGFMTVSPVPRAPVNTLHGSIPNSSPMQSGIMGSFAGNSGPGDFTFKPHHLQKQISLSRPNGQPGNQESSLLQPPMQTLTPQAPSFRVVIPNLIPSPGMQLFSRAQVGYQMGQSQAHMTGISFAGNPTGPSVPPRVPPFLNANPTLLPNRNFNAAPRPGPVAPMPGAPLHVRQNYTAAPTQSNFIAPNQNTNINPGGQVYDPFSPTSASTANR